MPNETLNLETLFVTRGDGELEGAYTITLNRPEKKNAINAQMWIDLLQVLRTAATDSSVRVVILTGAANEFCSGADLSGGRPGEPQRHQLLAMREVADVALELHRLPMPTIAKVGGVAAGAGCNMALGCDLIVAAERARFSEIFAKRGLALDFGGSWILPRLIGLHKAKELAFFAEVISAAEAERIGLVNRVVPTDELDAFVDDWARKIIAGPPLALRLSKRLLNDGLSMTLEQAVELEGWTQTVTIAATNDTTEAFKAFVEKRPPVFRGN
jgi:enoyl-CoA hydratase/carnithine racemase